MTCLSLLIALYPSISFPLSPSSPPQIEGSLFVVKRSYGVRFRLVVLNRINPNDLEQDLTGSFTFEDMSPYLLYRTKGLSAEGNTETLAIWFHNEKDRGHIAGCLRKVLRLQSTADQQQEEQQQAQQRELLLTSAALPPAPTVEEQNRMDGSVGVNTITSTSTSSSNSSAGGSSTTTTKKPTAIEELLMKAASLGGGASSSSNSSSGAGDASTTAGAAKRAAAASPPTVMDMLMRPKAGTGATTSTGATAAAAAAEAGRSTTGTIGSSKGGSALLNPLGLVRPSSSSSSSTSNGTGAKVAAGALDKQQLKEALLALIEDDAFLETLHRAYQKQRAK